MDRLKCPLYINTYIMKTLRIITSDGGQEETELGDHYYLCREGSEAFKRHNADADGHLDNCVAMIMFGVGHTTSIFLYANADNFIVSDTGKTYERINYAVR